MRKTEWATWPTAAEYTQTYCSQCGQPQGPGNSGYSACADHSADLARNAAKNNGSLYRAEIERAHRLDVAAGVVA